MPVSITQIGKGGGGGGGQQQNPMAMFIPMIMALKKEEQRSAERAEDRKFRQAQMMFQQQMALGQQRMAEAASKRDDAMLSMRQDVMSLQKSKISREQSNKAAAYLQQNYPTWSGITHDPNVMLARKKGETKDEYTKRFPNLHTLLENTAKRISSGQLKTDLAAIGIDDPAAIASAENILLQKVGNARKAHSENLMIPSPTEKKPKGWDAVKSHMGEGFSKMTKGSGSVAESLVTGEAFKPSASRGTDTSLASLPGAIWDKLFGDEEQAPQRAAPTPTPVASQEDLTPGQQTEQERLASVFLDPLLEEEAAPQMSMGGMTMLPNGGGGGSIGIDAVPSTSPDPTSMIEAALEKERMQRQSGPAQRGQPARMLERGETADRVMAEETLDFLPEGAEARTGKGIGVVPRGGMITSQNGQNVLVIPETLDEDAEQDVISRIGSDAYQRLGDDQRKAILARVKERMTLQNMQELSRNQQNSGKEPSKGFSPMQWKQSKGWLDNITSAGR